MHIRSLIIVAALCAACGSDDNNTSPDPNSNANSSANANPNASPNNAQGGSCFHNCVAPGPLGDITNFGCVSPSSDGDCASTAAEHCDGLGWGQSAANEFVADCNACSESCAPAWYDCASASCATDVN